MKYINKQLRFAIPLILFCVLINVAVFPVFSESINYCSETEVTEVNIKVEKPNLRNIRFETIQTYQTRFFAGDHFAFISNVIPLKTSTRLNYCLAKEFPKRAPPIKV